MSRNDDLASALKSEMNKTFKDKQVAYFLGIEDSPTNIIDWISTGNAMLDLAISNRPRGGVPVGRITEIMGLEASGKSLLAAHILAETQKKGGIAVYIDTEQAAYKEFLQAIGINLDTLIYSQMSNLANIFEFVESTIEKVRKSNSDKLVCIVVDSIMGATTPNESESGYEKDGYATEKAIIMSKAMRKITGMIAEQRISLVCTNQLRQKMGVVFGDQYTTSGGKSLGFHASVRIILKAMGQLSVTRGGNKEIIGVKTEAYVKKNRVGPPFRRATFDIFFNRGIDDYNGWLESAKKANIVTKSGSGSKLKIVDASGNEHTFMPKKWTELMESDAELRTFVYDKICEYVIMEYAAVNQDSFDPNKVEIIEQDSMDKSTD